MADLANECIGSIYFVKILAFNAPTVQCMKHPCFSHHHYQAWCHQIFFVNNKKIFVTSSVLKLQKWFLHQNGVESNQESKSDMYKLLGGVWRCVSYQKMCSRWLLA